MTPKVWLSGDLNVPLHQNLVIVRAGDNSLHESWLEPAGDRDFSLAVSYYGDHLGRGSAVADRFVESKGPKWAPLAAFIDDNWDWVSGFDYVALPDDDISATATDWRTVFAVMAELDLDLAQPSLDYQSFWTHQITARRPAYRARITNFVEGMTPVFSRWALERLLPTFHLSQSGWGLDVVWPAIVQKAGRRLGIIDEICVAHTRPFRGEVSAGAATNDSVYKMLSHPPQVDDMIMMQMFGVAHPFDPVVYSAVLAETGPSRA